MSGEGWKIPQPVFKTWGTHSAAEPLSLLTREAEEGGICHIPKRQGFAVKIAGTVPYIQKALCICLSTACSSRSSWKRNVTHSVTPWRWVQASSFNIMGNKINHTHTYRKKKIGKQSKKKSFYKTSGHLRYITVI